MLSLHRCRICEEYDLGEIKTESTTNLSGAGGGCVDDLRNDVLVVLVSRLLGVDVVLVLVPASIHTTAQFR